MIRAAGSAAASSGVAVLLAQSGAAVSHTGDTTETLFATVAVPANTLGKNGQVQVVAKWVKVGTAGTYTHNMYFGASGAGLTGSKLWTFGGGSSALAALEFLSISNDNATNAQHGTPSNSGGISTTTTALATSAIDTTAATEVVISATLGNSGDTLTLVSYQAVAYPQS